MLLVAIILFLSNSFLISIWKAKSTCKNNGNYFSYTTALNVALNLTLFTWDRIHSERLCQAETVSCDCDCDCMWCSSGNGSFASNTPRNMEVHYDIVLFQFVNFSQNVILEYIYVKNNLNLWCIFCKNGHFQDQ